MLQSGTQFELGAARGSLMLPTGAYHVEMTDAHEPGRLRGAVGSAETAQEAAPKTKSDIIYYRERNKFTTEEKVRPTTPHTFHWPTEQSTLDKCTFGTYLGISPTLPCGCHIHPNHIYWLQVFKTMCSDVLTG
jgi:hypothetical protein